MSKFGLGYSVVYSPPATKNTHMLDLTRGCTYTVVDIDWEGVIGLTQYLTVERHSVCTRERAEFFNG